ncbi:hypothetical protein [Teredinibacter turnerae]|uniref:hypothetical protein n=1 Tax=Teredinibacter turnerae TaxID=2426 RepID=UPI0005A2D19E|nr:hypothetical protein [Teredinibacter turnerae]
MKIFVVLMLFTHFLLGFFFCTWIAKRGEASVRWFVRVLVSLGTSILSIPLAVGAFAYTPGLRDLPGSFMEGALFVTFPLFFAVFSLLYYLVAKGIYTLLGKLGYVECPKLGSCS